MTASSVDELRALPDEILACLKSDRTRLMLGAFDRHIMHVRAQRSLGDRRRARGVVPLALE
jgi:hypothetical protein